MAFSDKWRVNITGGNGPASITEFFYQVYTFGTATSNVPIGFDASTNNADAPLGRDNNLSTTWVAAAGFPQTFTLIFNGTLQIEEYWFWAHPDGPTEWTLEQWDGANWIVEDTRTAEDPTAQVRYVVGEGTGNTPVDIVITIKNIVLNKPINIRIPIRNRVVKPVDINIPIKNIVLNKPVDIVIPIKNRVFKPVDIVISIRNRVVTKNISDSLFWTVKLLLGGIDVSANLTGVITWDREKGGAAIADFELFPFSGVVNIYDWIDQKVVIDWTELDKDGNQLGTYTIYKGVVNWPVHDPSAGTVKFNCTDNLQETFEKTTRSIIAGRLTNSRWSEHIFKDPNDKWSYHLQRMKTIPANYQLDINGIGQLTQWQAKATPDFVFTENDIFYGSIKTNLQKRRGLVNTIKLNIENRFNQRWRRTVNGNWAYPDTFWTWLSRSTGLMSDITGALLPSEPLPDQSMINSAINASGWKVRQVDFHSLPPSGFYGSPVSVGYKQNEYTEKLVLGFSFSASKNWLQTVKNNYQISVQSAASIGKHGVIADEENYSISGDAEDDWEDDEKDLTFAPVHVINNTDHVDFNYAEKESPAEVANAIETAIAKARVRLLSIYRDNSVEIDVPFNPIFDLSKTIEVNTFDVQAKGVLNRMVGLLNIETGESYNSLTIAISQPNIAGQSDDVIAAPVSPYQQPTNPQAGMVPLGTFYGNVVGAPEDSESFRGYIANKDDTLGIVSEQASSKGAPFYRERFVVEYPEPTAEERDEITHTGNTTHSVAIPQDNLIITE